MLHSSAHGRFNSTPDYFARLLITIFSVDLLVMVLFYPSLSRHGTFTAALADSALDVLFTAPVVWLWIIQPLSARNASGGSASRNAPLGLFMKMLATIFMIEFLDMLILPVSMPGADVINLYFADAYITTFLCAPLLWWIYSREQQSEIDALANLLGAPVKLYAMLLGAIFTVDLLEMPVLDFLSTNENQLPLKLVDAFLTTLIVSPFFWWIVIRPLRKLALSEKARSEMVRAQVVDAIVVIDDLGIIENFNPAAERIFGYAASAIVGRPALLLFSEPGQFMDDLLRCGLAGENDRGECLNREILGRRSDGSTLTLELSLSMILLDSRRQSLIIMRDISERKKMETALRDSEERFSIAVNGANEGIWDWNIVTGNIYHTLRLKELLGYTEGELAGVYATFESLLHPEDRDRIAEAVRRHLTERLPYDCECRLRTREGYYRWFRIHGQALWDESGRAVRMAGSISDISERKESEKALKESETRFREIFEQSEDAIIIFKPGACSIVDVNATAERLYGYSRTELEGSGLELLCRPEDFARANRVICNMPAVGIAQLDKMVSLRKDGTEILVSVRSKMITLQGLPVIYCTFRDISERVRMEEESRDIQAKLIQINKMASLGLLVSGVAHEINNPNNFIMSNSQLLDRVWQDALKVLREYYRENGDFQIGGVPFSELNEDSAQIFAGIIDGSRRIDVIVNNLKDFARQERSMTDGEVDVNRVVTTAVTILHHQLIKHTEKFHLDLAEMIPPVKGSSQQLEQVVINLLMNACQALPDKQCGIWVTTGYDKDAGQVTIAVQDEGTGMPDHVTGRMLEPFFTTKLDSGGTGLGLFISQSIVKEHNGALEFTSEPGKGTKFIVKIPAVRAAIQEHS